jgi:hypothetical protein
MSAWLDELAAWWAALPAEWVFLVLLPIAVAAAGLLADTGRRSPPEPDLRPARPARRRRLRHRGSH